VHARLRLGEAAEDAAGARLDGLREVARVEDREDVPQPAVMVLGLLDRHVDLRGAKGATADLAGGQLPARAPQRAHLGAERIGRPAGVEEGAEDHVAGGAAGAVEVGELHSGSRAAPGVTRPWPPAG